MKRVLSTSSELNDFVETSDGKKEYNVGEKKYFLFMIPNIVWYLGFQISFDSFGQLGPRFGAVRTSSYQCGYCCSVRSIHFGCLPAQNGFSGSIILSSEFLLLSQNYNCLECLFRECWCS